MHDKKPVHKTHTYKCNHTHEPLRRSSHMHRVEIRARD